MVRQNQQGSAEEWPVRSKLTTFATLGPSEGKPDRFIIVLLACKGLK